MGDDGGCMPSSVQPARLPAVSNPAENPPQPKAPVRKPKILVPWQPTRGLAAGHDEQPEWLELKPVKVYDPTAAQIPVGRQTWRDRPVFAKEELKACRKWLNYNRIEASSA